MILIIDHRDSFVHNLARFVALAGHSFQIKSYDEISVSDVGRLNPAAIVLSPGPCTPKEAGASVNLIKHLGPHIPFLGVCLGHQCMGEAYGVQIIRSEPVHGRASLIHHSGGGIFKDMPKPFEGGRYHSLSVVVDPSSPLHVTARTDDNIVMGLQHSNHPVYGVQFHPESILTPQGFKIIENFIALAGKFHQRKDAA